MTPADLMDIRRQGMKPKGEVWVSLVTVDPGRDDILLTVPKKPEREDWRCMFGLSVRLFFYHQLEAALDLVALIAPHCKELYFENLKAGRLCYVARGGEICQRWL